MDDKVIQFIKSSPQTAPQVEDEHVIFVCDCECSTFYVHLDGSACCANCGDKIVDSLGDVYVNTPETPTKELVKQIPHTVVNLGSSRVSMENTLSRASHDKSAFVLIAQTDGIVHWWISEGIDTAYPDHLSWLRERVDIVVKTMEESTE